MVFKKSAQSARFFMVPAWTLKSQQSTHKSFAPEFRIFSALKLTLCGLVVFININIYILTESTNLKTFLKENYLIALDSYKLHI